MRKKSFESGQTDSDEEDSRSLRHGSQDTGKQDASGWTRSYSDALPGIFKRSQAYDELRDDARDDFQKASGGNGSNTPLPDEPKGSMGLKQKKVPVDKAFSQINLGDRQNSAEIGSIPEGKPHGSPQKPNSTKLGTSKAQPISKSGAGAKTPPLPTKKTKMQTTDSDCSFEALQDEEVSPPEKGTMAVHGDKGMSPANPKTPVASNRSSDSGSAHIARSSPSLMTQAARLAASFGQAPRKAMTRRKNDVFSPMEEQSVTNDWDKDDRDYRADQENIASLPSEPVPETGRDIGYAGWVPEATSPGIAKPLLDRSILSETSPETAGKARMASTSQPTATRKSYQNSEPPQDIASSVVRIRARHFGPRALHSSPNLSSLDAREPDGVSMIVANDIFEPRPLPDGSQAAALSAGRSHSGISQSVADVKCMKGKDALQVLQRGSLLRKKWLGNSDAAEAQQSQKTERLIRCRVENNRVVLHYYHQGVKGLLAKEEMTTIVQRVEVPDGVWREGDCILVHTARGPLALAAPNAATHAIWVLGLNAALVSCSTRDLLRL